MYQTQDMNHLLNNNAIGLFCPHSQTLRFLIFANAGLFRTYQPIDRHNILVQEIISSL